MVDASNFYSDLIISYNNEEKHCYGNLLECADGYRISAIAVIPFSWHRRKYNIILYVFIPTTIQNNRCYNARTSVNIFLYVGTLPRFDDKITNYYSMSVDECNPPNFRHETQLYHRTVSLVGNSKIILIIMA